MTGPIHESTTESTAQLATVGYRGDFHKIAISVCLAGILVGGIGGELLREWLTSAAHQHTLFTEVLSSREVQDALASRAQTESAATNNMVPVGGRWVKDLFWEEGRVSFFVLGDGSFLFDSPRPPTWAFPLVLLCPALGFLIPWGVMKKVRR